MTKKGYITWHNYQNHRAMNFMGLACVLSGLFFFIAGLWQLRIGPFVGGLILATGGGFGVPRMRRWITRGRLSNVSFWDRIIGRTLFMIFSGIGILITNYTW